MTLICLLLPAGLVYRLGWQLSGQANQGCCIVNDDPVPRLEKTFLAVVLLSDPDSTQFVSCMVGKLAGPVAATKLGWQLVG